MMELIEVVDEDGNYTGQIEDRRKVHDLKLCHWEVVVFVVNNKKQVLLQKRSSNKRFYPNKWALCAGLVIAGESIEEAALRELNEEIGVKFFKEDLKILEENLNLTRFYYVMCNKRQEEFKIQEDEVSCVRWYDIEDVINMIKNKDNSIVIKESRLFLFDKLKNIEIN